MEHFFLIQNANKLFICYDNNKSYIVSFKTEKII